MTSFHHSLKLKLGLEFYSIAMYQPFGFSYPKLEFFDIRDRRIKISPNKFSNINKYRDTLYNLYWKRRKAINKWVTNITKLDIGLCCFCPYSQPAQKRIRQEGNFICHTEVIRKLLLDLNPKLVISNDADRQNKLLRVWGNLNLDAEPIGEI